MVFPVAPLTLAAAVSHTMALTTLKSSQSLLTSRTETNTDQAKFESASNEVLSILIEVGGGVKGVVEDISESDVDASEGLCFFGRNADIELLKSDIKDIEGFDEFNAEWGSEVSQIGRSKVNDHHRRDQVLKHLVIVHLSPIRSIFCDLHYFFD